MLFKKMRNFGFKKLIALIIALCVILSVAQSSVLLSLANPPEKKMLHLSDALSKVGLELSGDKITVGTEYTVEFKYKFNTGDLYTSTADAVSSPNAMFHIFYQTTTAPNAGRMQYLVGPYGDTKFAESNTDGNTAQFKFTISTASNVYYIGFLLNGAPDFYLADMVMYQSDDADKTNILPEQNDSNWKYLIIPTAGGIYPLTHTHAANSGFEPYNEDYFANDTPAAKQMLHFNSADTNSQRSGLKVAKEDIASGNYTLSFKYKMVKGSLCYGITDATDSSYSGATDAAVVAIYSNQGSDTLKMGYVKLPGAKSSYTYSNPDSCTVEYNFDISDDDINTCIDNFYIGFFIKGAPEFYVADMVMYKTSDSAKTNILPENPTAADWQRGTYKTYYNGQLPSGSEYVDYIADYFIPESVPVKQMLNLKYDAKTGIKIGDSTMEATQYVFEFDYNFKEGSLQKNLNSISNGAMAVVWIEKFDAAVNDVVKMQYLIGTSTPFDTIKEINSCRMAYTFTLSEAQLSECTGDIRIGFLGSGVYDLYLADMVLYKKNDTNKTDILPDVYNTSNWMYGYSKHGYTGLSSKDKILPYDETLFIPDTTPKEYMLNLRYDAKIGLRVGDNTMEPGQYTVEFDYCFKEGSLQKSVDSLSTGALFAVYSQQYDEGTASTVAMQYLIGYKQKFEKIVNIDTARMAYTFTLTQAQLDGCTGDIRIGFLGSGTYDLYVANMTMYKTSDSNKTNILPDVYDTDNWMYGYSKYGNIGLSSKDSIVEYDESIFVHNEIPRYEQMLAVDVTHDWSSFLGHKFDKNILQPGVEYTVTFKYHFDNSELDKGANFAIFYTTKNPRDGRIIDKIYRMSKDSTGMVLDTDFLTQYKDGANAKYTFSFDASELEEAVSMFIGFNMGGGNPKFYLYDLKLFKSNDTTETNLLSIDNYNDDISVWWGLYGETNEVYTRKYVNYDSSIFVPTSEKNLYIDLTFNGDDGEWWKPEDIQNINAIETITVKGTVTDQNGKPIPDARLLLKGTDEVYSASSDDKGVYIFSKIPVGLYELYLIDGYNREVFTGFSYFFNSGDTAVIDITCDSSKATFDEVSYNVITDDILDNEVDADASVMPETAKTGEVKGTLYNSEYKTVSGVKLYIRNVGEIVTDEQGNFQFSDIPVGDYELYTVLADGKEHIFRTVSIKENVELGVKLKYPDAVTEENNSWIIWVIIAAGAVILLSGGTTTVLLLRRKRLKK